MGNHRGNMGESWGRTIGESSGKFVNHRQPSRQHPQQTILGDGLRSADTIFQSAVLNLLCGANVKTRVGSSMHIVHNETPPIFRVLIGRHLIFCSLTSPLCGNSPRKFMSVKYKKRQKGGFPIVT